MKRLNNFLLLCLFGILCTVASAMAVDMGPSIQAKNIVFYGSDDDGYIVRCTRGNGNGRVLVAQKLTADETASDADWPNATALEAAFRTFDPAEYSNGSLANLPTDPVIVANLTGTNREVTVTGLTGDENIVYRVYEYNQSGSNYFFNTDPASLNPRGKKFIKQVASITLSAAVPACSTMAASWTPSGTFDYYELDVITNELVAVPPYTNFDIGNETSYLIEGLNPTTPYSWRISGYYGNNVVTSLWQTQTTLTTCDAPALSTTTPPKVYVGVTEKTGKTINAATITTINAPDETATPFALVLTFDQAMDPALGSVVLNNATDDADKTKNTFTEIARSWDNENKTLTLTYTIGIPADEPGITATLNDFRNVDGIAITANTATDALFSIDVTAPTATLELTVANGTGTTPTAGYAITGNVITATIAAGEAIAKPTGTFKVDATAITLTTDWASDADKKVWTATYTVPAYDAETPATSPQGVVALAASFKVKDLADNESVAIADYVYNAGNNDLTIDTQTPTATLELTVENGTGTAPATGYAITGNVITATIEAGEAIQDPGTITLNVGTGTIAFTNITSSFPTGDDANKIWTATYTVDAASTPNGVIAMPTADVTVTDLAGNVSGAIANYVYDEGNIDLTIDASAPTLTVEFSATNEFDAGKADSTSCTTTGRVSAPTYYNSTEDTLVITVAANEPVTEPYCNPAIENISGSVAWQAYTVENEVSEPQPIEGGTAQYWRGTYTYTEEPGTIATPSVTAKAVSGLASAATAATGTVTVATTAPTLTVKKIYSDLTNDKSKAGLTNKITIVLSSNEAIYYPTNLVLKDDAETQNELALCFAPATYSHPVGTKITANVPEICNYWIAEVPVKSLTGYTFTNGKLSVNNIAVKSETLGGAYNEKGILATPTFEDNNSIGEVTIFLTAPEITNLTLKSNNTNDNKLAKEGDVITLILTTAKEYPADEVTITPTVTVATTSTATPITFTPTYATSGSLNTWTLTHTVAADDPEGALSADVAFTYLYNAATMTTADNGDDADEVTIDRTAPTTTLVAEVNKDATPRTDGWAVKDDIITFTLTASEAIATPTGTFKVDATPITLSTNWVSDADKKIWTATYTVPAYDAETPENSPQGVVALAANFKVKDLAGNESAEVTAIEDFDGEDDISTVTVDTKAPSVETLAVSVAKANTNPAEARTDDYAQAGDVITFTLTADEALQEAPTAAFTVGNTVIALTTNWASDVNKKIWTAYYTVQANSPQGLVALNSTTYTITDLAGNITAAAAIIDDDVTVDTEAPSVNSLVASVTSAGTARTDGWAQATDVITFTLTADEALQAAPTATFKVGNTDITLNIIQGVTWTPSGAGKIWTAYYTVPAYVDATTPQGLVALNGTTCTLTDLAGNTADANAAVTFDVDDDISTVTVDTKAPSVETLAVSVAKANTNQAEARTDGYAQATDVITFTLTADEALQAAPTATFKVGETAITLTNTWTPSGADKKIWTATYTVPANSPQGLVALNSDTYTITDLAGNASAASATFTTVPNDGITVDTDVPGVTSLVAEVNKDATPRTDGWAQATDVITFTLTADEALQVAPTAAFKVGNTVITLTTDWATTDVNKKIWTATYTVPAYVDATSPQGVVALNGTTCTLTDLAGNTADANAAVTFNGDDDISTVTVDTEVPTLASARITSNNANTSLAKAGDVVTFTFTADEAINTPTIKLYAGSSEEELTGVVVAATAETGNKTWTATYTVANDSPEGNIYAVVSGITDLAGNAYTGETTFNATTLNTTDNSHVTIDITAPTATLAASVAKSDKSARTDGWAQAGDVITFTLTADEAIAATTVAFKVGETAITLTTDWASDADKKIWTATYTVVANTDGELALNENYTIIDLADNESDACSTFTTTPNDGITVDTKAPVVTITKVKGAAYDENPATIIYVDDVCTFEYNVVEYNAGATTVALGENTTQLPTPTSNPVNFNELPGWSSIDGAFDLTVASTDAAGNKGTIIISNLTKRADLAKPTIVATQGAENSTALDNNSTLCVGTAYTLSVSNTAGTYPDGTTYEWYKGDDKIDDQKGASLSVPAGNETEPTTYTVKAVNADYCTNTSAASEVFTVVVKPVLTQPTIAATQGAENLTALDNNSTICVGTAYKLSVSNTAGTYPDGTTYEWYKGGTKIDAQTGASLSVRAGSETAPTTYTYTVKVLHSDYCADVTSTDFVVTVKPSMAQPTIAATANSGITTVAGVNYACAAGFTLTASTTDNLNTTQDYLWYSKDGADAEYVKISGKTTASLAQPNMTAGTHYYKVVAQKGDNYCSNSAESEEYVVIINPTNFTVGITGTYKETETSSDEPIVDNTITSGLPYSITLTGAIDPKLAPVISYQWQKKTTGGTYSNLLAATATTKALTVNITQFGIYDYRLIVTTIDGCQTTRTQDFTLNVLQPLGTATLAATSAAICPEEKTSVTATLNLSEMPEVTPTCQLQKETTTTPATWGNVGAAENVTVANMTPTHTFGNLGLGKYRAVFACGGYASVTTGVFEVTAKFTLDTPTITAKVGDGETFEGPVCPGTQVKLTPSVPEGTTGTTTYTWKQSSDNTNFALVTEGVDANGVLTVTASNAPTYYKLSAVNADYCIGLGAAYTLNVNTAAHPNYTIVSNDQDNEVAPGNQVTLTATPGSTAVDSTYYTWYYAIAADAPVDASGWTEITAQTAGYTIANDILTATISTVPSTWFKVVAHAPTVCTDGSATLKITTTLVLPTLTLDNDADAATPASANVCDVETVELTAAFAVATEGVSYLLEKETANAGVFANEGEAKTTVPFTWAVGVGKYRVVASKTNYTGQTSNEFIITPKPAIQPAVTVNPFTQGTICVGSALTLEATYPESVTAPTNAHYQWQSAASNLDASYADITDATAATYTVPTTSPAAMTYYRVVVTSDDLCGEDKSAGVAVVVNPNLPTITLEIAGQEKTAEGAYTAINEAKDVLVGNTVQLTATATDAPANTEYAWYEGTSAAGNALTTAGEYTVNGATLTIASNTAGEKNFTVKVSNPGYCGDETATYTYTVKPQMPTPTVLLYLSGTLLQPANAITICEGSDVEISAGFSEQVSNNVTCAWSKDPANGFTDADADTLTYTGVTAANAGSYTVTVTHPDYYGSATSDAFSLVVKPTATVDEEDFALTAAIGGENVPSGASTELLIGEELNFTVNIATDLPAGVAIPTTFAWTVNDVVQASIASTFSYAAQTAGPVTVTVKFTPTVSTNYCGSITEQTRTFIYTVKAPTPITVSISANVNDGAEVCSDANVVLTATAENVPEDATPTYAWQKYNGTDYEVVNGANGNTLTPTLTGGNYYNYKVVATVGENSYTSDAFTFTVKPDITDVTISSNKGTYNATNNTQTVCYSEKDVIILTANGGVGPVEVGPANSGPTTTYTWYSVNGNDETSLTTGTTYTLTGLAAGSTTTYRVKATSNYYCGTATKDLTIVIGAKFAKGTIAVTTAPTCESNSAVITWSGATAGSTIQWQTSTDSSTWTNNGTANPLTLSDLAAGTTIYVKALVSNVDYCASNVAIAPETITVNPTATVDEEDFALTAAIGGENVPSVAQVATGTEVNFAVNTTLPAGVVAPASYAWYIGTSQTAVADQTGSTFSYAAQTAGPVTVTVKFTPTVSTNYCGSITEQTRTFTYSVVAAPIAVSISANGVANNGSVCSDANVVLTATAENVPEGVTPIYAWQKLSGAEYVDVTTDDGLEIYNTFSPYLTTNAHNYRVVVTVNNADYTSDAFTFAVNPTYTANNVSVAIAAPAAVNLAAVPAGTEVTFTATPNPATLTYTYQWYVNGAAVTDATKATYTYTAPAAGTIGYVYCVATLNDGTICKDASWNGEKTSNTAAVTAIADPNALGTISNFSLVSKKKISAKLTWTRANESDNVVIIIKPVLSGGLPAGIASGSFSGITQGINADYTAATAVAAIEDYKVVYKGNNIGGVSTTDTLEITGLSRSTNYTAFAFICNSNYSQNTIEPVRVTFKTNAYKEAYEITDPNFDGEFSLSPINPNPITGDELNFNIDSWVNANYEIELFNSNGDYITGMTQMLSEGIHSMKLDLNSQKGGLNSGAYVLRVTSNGQTLSQPVRIVR